MSKKKLTKEQLQRKNELRKARRNANIDKTRKDATDYAKAFRIKNPEWALMSNMRCRSREKNLEFNITREDIIIPEYCPILGIKLMKVEEENYKREHTASVDRIDNSKGYTKDNIRIISLRANRLKSDANIEEIRAILKYMEDNINDQ